ESEATQKLYGLDQKETRGFGEQCLVARRMMEQGVRFVELIDTGGGNWDQHSNMPKHETLAKGIDRPIAGLLKDLESRGMLEDTLVVWTTEFGRGPVETGNQGRSHQGSVYSM